MTMRLDAATMAELDRFLTSELLLWLSMRVTNPSPLEVTAINNYLLKSSCRTVYHLTRWLQNYQSLADD